MPNRGDKIQEEIALVRKMIDRGDFEEIHEMVSYWRSVKSLGALSGMVRRTVIGAAMLIGALALVNDTVRDGVRKWLGF